MITGPREGPRKDPNVVIRLCVVKMKRLTFFHARALIVSVSLFLSLTQSKRFVMYINWNERIEVVKTLKWYRLDDLLVYLHTLRENLVTTVGRLSHSYMPKLEPVCPASPESRFPDNTIFICEGYGDWGARIDRLQLTISIVLHANKIDRKYPGVRTQGDAEIAVLDCIDDLLKTVEETKDVFVRCTFEERYKLQWVEDEEEQDKPARRQHSHQVASTSASSSSTSAPGAVRS